ncbi:hypothetical protein C8J57DRAFT_1574360 [Mycena rebaudengoi]|nr:hypothetical protein C8J57DRAFT_1574360 [Mycena rebaudengoi]
MSDSGLYSRLLLLPKGHGYPLFHPQPFDDLPFESLRVGTDIGDVGVVTSDGAFDVIFNICRSADDPVNRFGVPQGLSRWILVRETSLPECNITVLDPTRGDIDLFERGRRLLLPDGASRTDLRRKKKIQRLRLKHARAWYAFVNGDLERMVDNGDLYLVTGTDNHVRGAHTGWICRDVVLWEWQTANSFTDSALDHFQQIPNLFPVKESRNGDLDVDSKPADILSKTGGSPFSQSRSGGFFRGSTGSMRGGAVDNDELSDASAEYFPANPRNYHPSSPLMSTFSIVPPQPMSQ